MADDYLYKANQDANTRHPFSTYEGQYPHIYVWQHVGGAEFHVDSTPGKQRIRQAAHNGTYYEISEDGRKVEVVKGNNHSYVQGGSTSTTDKNQDQKTSGDIRKNVSGATHEETAKTQTAATNGHSIKVARNTNEFHVGSSPGGQHDKYLNGDQNYMVDGSVHQSTKGDVVHMVEGNHITSIKGEQSNRVEGTGNRTDEVGGNYKIHVGGKFIVYCDEFEVRSATTGKIIAPTRLDLNPA